jgi:predicted DNA-binding transcriptional regulator YafY
MAGRKPRDYSQAARLFKLVDRLQSRRFGMRVAELAEDLAVSDKTIKRDLSQLAEIGFNTERVDRPGEPAKVRLVDPPGKPIRLTQRERYALLAVRHVFDVLQHTPLREDVRSIYGKAAAGLDAEQLRELESMGERFVYLPDSGVKGYGDKSETLDGLLTGVLKRLRVDYEYARPGKVTRGVMAPYAVVLYRHGLYVIGQPEDEAADGPRVYAAERFRSARHRRGDRFEVPEGFSVDRHFQGAFGIFVGGEPIEVEVDFDAQARPYVEARTWHASERRQCLPDGGIRLNLQVTHTAEVLSWVLGWGSRARVRKPESLVAQVRDELRALQRRYEA